MIWNLKLQSTVVSECYASNQNWGQELIESARIFQFLVILACMPMINDNMYAYWYMQHV